MAKLNHPTQMLHKAKIQWAQIKMKRLQLQKTPRITSRRQKCHQWRTPRFENKCRFVGEWPFTSCLYWRQREWSEFSHCTLKLRVCWASFVKQTPHQTSCLQCLVSHSWHGCGKYILFIFVVNGDGYWVVIVIKTSKHTLFDVEMESDCTLACFIEVFCKCIGIVG